MSTTIEEHRHTELQKLIVEKEQHVAVLRALESQSDIERKRKRGVENRITDFQTKHKHPPLMYLQHVFTSSLIVLCQEYLNTTIYSYCKKTMYDVSTYCVKCWTKRRRFNNRLPQELTFQKLASISRLKLLCIFSQCNPPQFPVVDLIDSIFAHAVDLKLSECSVHTPNSKE